MAFALRDYQQKAVDGVRAAYAQGHKAVLLVSPTGSGKTVCFAHIVHGVESKGKAVTILVHREELVTQCSLSLAENGLNHRLIVPSKLQRQVMRDHVERFGQNYLHPATDVVVASVQTLVRNFQKLPPPDLIVTDESHHSVAGNYLKIYEKYSNARLLGVTATPERLDGRGLGEVYSTMVEAPGTQWMIDNGYLCRPKIYAPDPSFDTNEVGEESAKGRKKTEEKVNTRKITGDAVQHYRELCDGMPAVAFCVSVKHAEDVAEEFRAAGYRAIALDGGTDKEIRKGALAALGRGELDVVTSCDLISEGVDLPLVAVCIMLRPSASLVYVLQAIGRCLRRYPVDAPIMRKPHMQKLIGADGTHYAYILDHAGNTRRHGLPQADREWSLDGKKDREKKETPERKCPECGTWHPIFQSQCPECEHSYLIDKEEASGSGARIIEQVAGQLIEVTETPPWACGFNLRTDPLKQLVAMAKTKAHFDEIASARGYKQGWAYFAYSDKFGRK